MANGNVYLGRAVACTRLERGWKVKEMVRRVGMSMPYLYEIENGVKTPSNEMLDKIAQALGVTTSALLARAEEIERLYG